MTNDKRRWLVLFVVLLTVGCLTACRSSFTPTPQLSRAPATPTAYDPYSFQGVVLGPLAGADVSFFELHDDGSLTALAFPAHHRTSDDGTFSFAPLPEEYNRKVFVIQASGGELVDKVSGQRTSFAGHSLYAAWYIQDVGSYPHNAVVTPLTDLAFRMARKNQEREKKNAWLTVSAWNAWFSDMFDIGKNYMNEPNDITQTFPINLYDGQYHHLIAPETKYARAILGIYRQAAEHTLSPAVWLEQMQADAEDDGMLNGAAQSSIHAWQYTPKVISGSAVCVPSGVNETPVVYLGGLDPNCRYSDVLDTPIPPLPSPTR